MKNLAVSNGMSPIANMLTQIKNAQAVGHEYVTLPFSKVKFEIAKILKNSGFLSEVEKKKKKGRKVELDVLSLKLKYGGNAGAISGIKLISKPSKRIYAGKERLKPVRNGYGIAVISTPKGVMTGDEARKLSVGGEILFEIW